MVRLTVRKACSTTQISKVTFAAQLSLRDRFTNDADDALAAMGLGDTWLLYCDTVSAEF